MRYRVFITDPNLKGKQTQQFFGNVLTMVKDELMARIEKCGPNTRWEIYENKEVLIERGHDHTPRPILNPGVEKETVK